MKPYYPHENRYNTEKPPQQMDTGPWHCMCIEDDDYHSDFLEVHLSATGRGVVFRVSLFQGSYGEEDGDIRLGSCAIMDREKATAVRDRLNEILAALPEKEDDEPTTR